MKTKEEMRSRLKEVVEARRALLLEELEAEKQQGKNDLQDCDQAEELAHLTGVIMTLEWVLGIGAGVEYES